MKINLLPAEKRPLRSNQIRWEFVILLITFLGFTAITAFSFLERSNLDSLQHEFDGLVQYRSILQLQRARAEEMQAEVSAIKAEHARMTKILKKSEDGFTISLLDQIQASVMQDIYFERFVKSTSVVELRGYTENLTSLTQFIQRLEDFGNGTRIRDLRHDERHPFLRFYLEIERRR